MNIALIAESSAGVKALGIIAASPHQLSAVLTSRSSASGGSRNVWVEAEKLGLQPIPAREVKYPGLADEFRSRNVDVIINVHSLHVIRSEVIASARVGAFNLHPGPLPRYAGLNAPSWAIYRGEPDHGVTLHRMTPDIDAGPIAYQALFPIAPDDTGLTLNYKCWKEGLSLLDRLLQDLSTSPASIPAKRQDLSQREYFSKGVPQNGRIDWLASASTIHDFVRACDFFPYDSPWGVPTATFQDKEIGILRTSLTGKPCREKPGTVVSGTAGVLVACADAWLRIETVMLQAAPIDAGDVFMTGGLCSLA